MVSTHRALVRTTAVLAALLVASASAATPQAATDVTTPATSAPNTTPTPTPSSSASTTTPAPSSSAPTGKSFPLHAIAACVTAKLAVIDKTIDLSCSGQSKGAVVIGSFDTLEVAVESSELVIESLGAASIPNLQIHGGAPGATNYTGVAPVVRFDTSLATLSSITALSFTRVNFSTNSPTLKIPDTVGYLKLDGTNAVDVSLDVSKSSSLTKVDFLANPMATIPKCLYERHYSNKIEANVALADNSPKYLSEDIMRNLTHNINPTKSSFDVGSCLPNTVSADGAASDKLRVCASKVSSPLTPTPSYGATAPSDGAASTSKGKSSSNTTLIAILSAVAVVAVVVGAVFFRKLLARRSGASQRDDNAVNLIGKDDTSGNGKLSFISGDETLRALRLQQHEVTLSKALGTGRLWLGEYAGTKVLVKRIEAEVSDAYVTKNLMSQSQVLATLKHDNIVSLVGVTWLAGTDFAVVAEFMDKSNLKAVLADTNWPLDIHAKLRMCTDIAQGLAYLHDASRNLYVRNFSSRKVLVNSSSECKLNVFDIYPSATKFEPIESYGAGEIAWLAPELITHSSPQDARKINMYAFGVVMCEILARAAPFQSLAAEKGNTLSDVEIVQRVRRHEVLAPHEDRPEYLRAPQSLRDAIDRCLAHSPLDRPSAHDVLAALEVASSEITATQLLI